MTASASSRQALMTELADGCERAIRASDSPETVDTLYHLTDAAGFIGIVENREIWATLATCLNDCSEVVHASNLAHRLLEDRLRSGVNEYDLALLGYLKDPTLAPPEVRYETFPLVASFCGQCDRSGQWLHYGRAGRGVAVGFTPEIASLVDYDLVKVDYDADSQRGRIESLFSIGRELVETQVQTVSTYERRQLALQTAHLVSLYFPFLAARLKHPSFREEDEWRLVAHEIRCDGKIVAEKSASLVYRRVGDSLLPYEPLSFRDRPNVIAEIVLGYSSPMAPEAARLLLSQRGYEARVKRSDVPVR